jgi:hypothetical protein
MPKANNSASFPGSKGWRGCECTSGAHGSSPSSTTLSKAPETFTNGRQRWQPRRALHCTGIKANREEESNNATASMMESIRRERRKIVEGIPQLPADRNLLSKLLCWLASTFCLRDVVSNCRRSKAAVEGVFRECEHTDALLPCTSPDQDAAWIVQHPTTQFGLQALDR